MKKIEFRAKDDEGNWNYGKGNGDDISNFFSGIGGGQLNSDTLEQLVGPVTDGGTHWERVEL